MTEFDGAPEDAEEALEKFRATLQDMIHRHANSGSPHGEFLRDISIQVASTIRKTEIELAQGVPVEIIEHRATQKIGELEKLTEAYKEFLREQQTDRALPDAEGQ